MKTKNIRTSEDLSSFIWDNYYCKSRWLGNSFNVSYLEERPHDLTLDPKRVYVSKTTPDRAEKDFLVFLNKIALIPQITAKIDASDTILIKANFAPASQKAYHYFTNPRYVNLLIKYLQNEGFSRIAIVESETNAKLGHSQLTPQFIGKRLGFEGTIIDLSTEKQEPIRWKRSTVDLASIMLNPKNFIINFAKPKNHDLMFFTGALKNMYGSIPHFNKWRLFHKKESGLSVAEAILMVNYSSPADLILCDFVESIDGNEVSYFKHPITDFPYYYPNRFIAGKYPLSVDKYLASKMGYGLEESPVLKVVSDFTHDYGIDASFIEGDTLDAFPDWKKVGLMLNLKAKTQDLLPVSNELVGKGIRMYEFSILRNDQIKRKIKRG